MLVNTIILQAVHWDQTNLGRAQVLLAGGALPALAGGCRCAPGFRNWALNKPLVMRPTLSQVCSLNSPLERDVEDYAAGKCESIELWLTKVESYLETASEATLRDLLEEHGVVTPVASLQGGLLASQGDARRVAWDLFAERLRLCHRLQVETLVVACDVPHPLTASDLQRVRHSLVEVAQVAGPFGVRVALEPQAGAAIGNNLQTATALVEEVGSPHLGICLDSFHYYVGPSKEEDLQYLTSANLFHVQLADVGDQPRELVSDRDRILPGEGGIDLQPILQRLTQIPYQGCVSIELMNPQIAQIPALQFGEIALTALRKILGLATA